jgi:hypothetical protein
VAVQIPKLTELLQQVRADVAQAMAVSQPLVETGRSALPTLPAQLRPLIEPYLARWESEASFLAEQLKNCDSLIQDLRTPDADYSVLFERSQRLLVDLERQTMLVMQERSQLEPLIAALSPAAVATAPRSEADRTQMEEQAKVLIAAIEAKNKLLADAEWIWARVIQFPRG